MKEKTTSGLKTRAVTGIIFALTVFALIMFDKITASILMLIITIFCSFEYVNIVRQGLKDPTFNLSMLLGVGPIILSFIKPEWCEGYEFFILMICFIIMMAFSIFSLILNVRTNHNMLAPIIVLFYIGLPFAAIDRLLIHGESYMKIILIGIMFSLWISDTGAYFVGRWLGKTPLHLRVSPKKTIEGSIGAGVLSSIFAVIFSYTFPELSLAEWISLMLVGWIAGTWGDLYESSIKRRYDVKDSGNLLPGHGGFLDRFDSFIFAAPAVVLILFTFFDR